VIAIKQTIVCADGSRRELSLHGVSIATDQSMTGLSKADWRKLLIRAWRVAGAYWHKVILPKHFTMAAYAEYDYRPRSLRTPARKDRNRNYLSYVVAKGKYKGHALPLVWSGELKRQVARIEDVRADSMGARVILHGPKYLWQYRKDLNQPEKAAELAAVSEADSRVIAEVMDRFIAGELKPALVVDKGHQGQGADIYGGHAAPG